MGKLRILSHSPELFADRREAKSLLARQLTRYRAHAPLSSVLVIMTLCSSGYLTPEVLAR